MMEVQRFQAVLEQHHDELPVFLIVPPAVPACFRKERTFVVEAAIDGQAIGRRSVKPWGDGRWFLEFTKAHRKQLGVGPGSNVTVDLRPAEEVPADLASRIAELGLDGRWQMLSEAERRTLAEAVFEAKKPETRRARIERIVAKLRTG
jgi:hypothetical protein